ncbi:type II secretion system F family protein [Francisella sp. SYW-9]|uniref:type II secretion system F family protein n=1 Tax=Francisella sp. SYW-9 TaxID=2610888 RepID=UPI00123D1D24|nr:type II secretion system F family protein [Francisella sp. SYW-9]
MFNSLLAKFKSKANVSNSMYSKYKLLFLRLCFFSFVRINFYEQLLALLKADIAMYDALVLMKSKYQSHKTIFKTFWIQRQILDDMIYRISAGYGTLSLAELLEGLVPGSDLVILSVDSRKVNTALDKVTQIIAKFNHLKIEVSKMFFPSIAALLLLVILIFMANAYIFPILLTIKPLDKLPSSTYGLYEFCHFFASNLYILILVLIIAIIAIAYSLPSLRGVVRKVLDKIPPYNIYKQLTATSFLISLSLLLQAGDDFFSAIHKIQHNTSKYLSEYLECIFQRISLGDRPGEALAGINLFMQSTQIYIEILDEAHALSEGIASLTDRSVDMQIRSIKRLLTSINTVLLFTVIGFGLWFYVGITEVGFSI